MNILQNFYLFVIQFVKFNQIEGIVDLNVKKVGL